MPAPPKKPEQLFSIQSVYNLYVDENALGGQGCLRCRNKIEIPVAEPVRRVYGSNECTVTPVTALVFENRPDTFFTNFDFLFETNEGVTVEPIVVHDPFAAKTQLYLLNLPRGTTSVKNVRATLSDGSPVSNDLMFDIMKAPYNYENYLFYGIINDFRTVFTAVDERLLGLQDRVSHLETRVTALENKESN